MSAQYNRAVIFPDLSEQDGHPQRRAKRQPWKQIANLTADVPAEQHQSKQHIVVACPKTFAWGSGSLGGSW